MLVLLLFKFFFLFSRGAGVLKAPGQPRNLRLAAVFPESYCWRMYLKPELPAIKIEQGQEVKQEMVFAFISPHCFSCFFDFLKRGGLFWQNLSVWQKLCRLNLRLHHRECFE